MNKTYTLEEFLADYDWREAFGAAMGTEPDAHGTAYGEPKRLRGVVGYSGSTEPVTRADVAEILAISDGENDERDWIGAFRLKDGRFAFVRAGCDFTGWDCRAGGDAEVAGSLDDLVRLAMNDEERERLGFPTIGTSLRTDE